MSQTMQKNKKLYVGSLPYGVTEEELRNLFSGYGVVESARIITDKFTSQSKGFGFVEMASVEDAEKAIQGANGTTLGGRTLIVNAARPEEPRSRDRSFGGGGNRFGGEDREGRDGRSNRRRG